MKKFLSNAFSIQMLASFPADVSISEVAATDIPMYVVSCIGHADTANVLTDMLGFDVPCNRQNVTVDADTDLYVAQVVGGRLPEGAITLPEGYAIKFFKVNVGGKENG